MDCSNGLHAVPIAFVVVFKIVVYETVILFDARERALVVAILGAQLCAGASVYLYSVDRYRVQPRTHTHS